MIITTGDHVKDEKSADCWIEMSEEIKDKMKIAIGNHDTEFANIYKQIVDYHQLKKPYYSYDFTNVHFISILQNIHLNKEVNNMNLSKAI